MGAKTPLASLSINGNNTFLAVDTPANGNTPYQPAITTTGAITFNSPVELVNNATENGSIATITSKSGAIAFNNPLDPTKVYDFNLKGYDLNLTADTVDLTQANFNTRNFQAW